VKKPVSRRSFLKRGAVALGTVAVCEVRGLTSAAQTSGSKPVGTDGLKERAMPHVIVKMYPGRAEEQKRRLAEAIVKDVVSNVGGSEDSVSVAIEEIAPAEWAEKVYRPDILNAPGKLYKKPGYSM
jgi:4-oxalocrotonate tautomerase